MIDSFHPTNNIMYANQGNFGGGGGGGNLAVVGEMSAMLQALTQSLSMGGGQSSFMDSGSLPGLAALGQTNPFFNAGFSGGMGDFYGSGGGQMPPGTLHMSETTGCDGKPSSVELTWNASPTCQPSPCENKCSANSCSAQPQNDSLAGATVWGDPHIKDANGNTQNFSSPDGLFINGNGAAVLTQANASNQETNSVQAFAPGQAQLGGIDADPNNVQVYEQVNGTMKDLGSAASLGFYQNSNDSGTNVAANQSVYLGDGVDVNWNPNAPNTVSTVTFNQENSVA